VVIFPVETLIRLVGGRPPEGCPTSHKSRCVGSCADLPRQAEDRSVNRRRLLFKQLRRQVSSSVPLSGTEERTRRNLWDSL